VLAGTESALREDGAMLGEAERARIEAGVASLRELSRGEDHRAIKDGIEALGAATAAFAQERMNRSIRSALAGHRLDEIEL